MESINFNFNSKIINVREWKVKDRKKYKEVLQNFSDNNIINYKLFEIFVDKCLTEKIALNSDEREQIFYELRKLCIGDEYIFSDICGHCGASNKHKIKLSEIFKFNKIKDNNVKVIEADGIKIELEPVKNIDFYNDTILKSNDKYLDDLILHIKSINGDESMGFNEYKEYFDELNIRTMENILEEWKKNQNYFVSREIELKCDKCDKKTKFWMENIPNLLPVKWFN